MSIDYVQLLQGPKNANSRRSRQVQGSPELTQRVLKNVCEFFAEFRIAMEFVIPTQHLTLKVLNKGGQDPGKMFCGFIISPHHF